MFNIGPAELLIIGLVLLIAVGPEQLPSVIRRAGSTVAQFRSMTDGLRSEFMAGLDEIERATDIESWSAEDSDVGKGDAATRRSAANDTSARLGRNDSSTASATAGDDAAVSVTGDDVAASVTGDEAAAPEPDPEPSAATSQVSDTLFTDPARTSETGPASDPDVAAAPAANGASDSSEGATSNPVSPAEAGEETP